MWWNTCLASASFGLPNASNYSSLAVMRACVVLCVGMLVSSGCDVDTRDPNNCATCVGDSGSRDEEIHGSSEAEASSNEADASVQSTEAVLATDRGFVDAGESDFATESLSERRDASATDGTRSDIDTLEATSDGDTSEVSLGPRSPGFWVLDPQASHDAFVAAHLEEEVTFHSVVAAGSLEGDVIYALTSSLATGGATALETQLVRWDPPEAPTRLDPPDSANYVIQVKGLGADGSIAGAAGAGGGALSLFAWSENNGWVSPSTEGYVQLMGASLDGSVLVGSMNPSGYQGLRWSVGDEPLVLPPFAGDTAASATAVSGDGNRTFGISQRVDETQRAVYWDQTEPVVIQVPPQFEADWSCLVSSDGVSRSGAVATGACQREGESIAFRWTEALGATSLGQPADLPWAKGDTVTADGTVIVGSTFSSNLERGSFRWDPERGFQMFELPSGCSRADPLVRSLTSDGKRYVVNVWCDDPVAPVRAAWVTDDGDVIWLEPSPSGAEALSLSADGLYVAGRSQSEAVVWDRNGKGTNVHDALSDNGAEMRLVYTPEPAMFVAPGGRTIYGNGELGGDSRAWVAVLP
jgi:uncharacterized membrane protein